ncbi:MAG: TIGR04255 family protein [Gammaproteobacteria bacterium]|nr:TIGR04255 family protein [Gammaproteobacteria bacterium]
MDRRIYKNPPIEEALCEFRFTPSTEWDFSYQMAFWNSVRDIYDGKPRTQTGVEAGFQESGELGGPAFSVRHENPKIQIPSKDNKKLVSIGPHVLSVHSFRKYPGWENFKSEINEALNKYYQAVSPKGIVRIGLRYINQIQIPNKPELNLNSFFVSLPNLPGETKFPKNVAQLLVRTEHVYDDLPIKLILTFANATKKKGSISSSDKSTFLLDLDLVWLFHDRPLEIDDAMEVVEILRERERDAFEALLTDEAKDLFDD